jgi:beta-lactamase regulating signal transducer with metallopeptidase domain
MKNQLELIILIIITVCFNSCSIDLVVVAPEVEEHLELYKEEAKERNQDDRLHIPLRIEIRQLDEYDPLMRGAYTIVNGVHTIFLDQDMIDRGDKREIEYVLVHELGHVLFGYTHDEWFMQIQGFGSHREGFYDAFFEEHMQGTN